MGDQNGGDQHKREVQAETQPVEGIKRLVVYYRQNHQALQENKGKGGVVERQGEITEG